MFKMHIRANDYNYLVSLMSRRSLFLAAPEETKTATKKKKKRELAVSALV